MKHILASVLLLASSSATVACSFKERTDAELVAQAKIVFRARVTEVKLATLADPANPSQNFEVVEARYEIKEVLKGVPPESGVVRDVPFGPGNCGLVLLPGLEYVFFPGEHNMVLAPTGSFGYFNAEGTAVKPRLDSLRKLAAPAK